MIRSPEEAITSLHAENSSRMVQIKNDYRVNHKWLGKRGAERVVGLCAAFNRQ